VQAVFEEGEDGLLTPPFTHPAAGPIAKLMAFYNRRLARIAEHRRRLGLLGRMNDRQRTLIPGFTLGRGEIRKLARPLRQWLMLELTEGWRTWGHAASTPASPRLLPAAKPRE
jgi:hypothetical protein